MAHTQRETATALNLGGGDTGCRIILRQTIAHSSWTVPFFDAGVIVEEAAVQAMFDSPCDARGRRLAAAISSVEEGVWAH